jgi:hypothetical protein
MVLPPTAYLIRTVNFQWAPSDRLTERMAKLSIIKTLAGFDFYSSGSDEHADPGTPGAPPRAAAEKRSLRSRRRLITVNCCLGNFTPAHMGKTKAALTTAKPKRSPHRGWAPGLLWVAPIKQRRGDRHRAVGHARPQEAALFRSLGEQAGALAVVPDHLHKATSASSKDKEVSVQRIVSRHFLHLQRQPRTDCSAATGRQGY